MNSLIKRTLTGTIYVAVIVLSIIFTSWAFPIVCAIFATLGLIEYDKLTRDVGSNSGVAFTIDSLFAVLTTLPAAFGVGPMMGFLGLTLYAMVRLVAQLYLKSPTPITDSAKSFLAFAWIVAPLIMLEFLWSVSRPLVLVMFIMIWLNDTGAFIVGCTMGRHKLFERVSPKKTWEGFFGGLAFTAVFGYFTPQLLELCSLPSPATAWLMLAMGCAVSIVGTFGDLCESLFKRALHAKDSGNILPGHGGILDRIDSLLLVTPTIFLTWLVTLMVL